MPFEELLLSELKLEPCQWEERPVGAGAAPPELAGQWLEADCLVNNLGWSSFLHDIVSADNGSFPAELAGKSIVRTFYGARG